MSNIKIIISFTLLILFSSSYAKEDVYKWKNNKGNTVYSDIPLLLTPLNTEKETINNNFIFANNSSNNKSIKSTKNDDLSSNLDNDEKSLSRKSNEEKTKEANQKIETDFKNQNCKIAKRNLDLAKSAVGLDESNRENIIKTYEQDIEKYCD